MHTYSLSDITHILEKTFHEVFSEFEFYCSAELLKVKPYKSRYYLELVEYGSSGQIVAKAQGIIWEQEIVEKFIDQTHSDSFLNFEGKKILFRGRYSFHHLYGRSISINEIDANFVLGAKIKEVQNIRKRLIASGVYELNKSKTLGFPPFSLAVISGSTSAGLQDFEQVIKTEGWNIERDLFPSGVEGNNAATEVLSALEKIETTTKNYNAVVIIRGGGGSSGMERLNNENLCQKICAFPIAVCVGIGHTKDLSLVDEISRYSGKTPTEVAYFLGGKYAAYQNEVRSYYEEIKHHLKHFKREKLHTITSLHSGILQAIGIHIKEYQYNIKQRYALISYAGTDIYKKGYATIHDKNGKQLRERELKSMESGEKITIKTVTLSIDVTINQILKK